VGLYVRSTVFPHQFRRTLCLWLTAEPGHIEPRPCAFLASDEPAPCRIFIPKVGVSFVKSRFRTIQARPKDLWALSQQPQRVVGLRTGGSVRS
jgi:hypothetical protein